MTPHEAQNLLGGYATGTLTEAERKILFQAALDDQDLFDALADEEALRELLTDPAVRRRLVNVLATAPAKTEERTERFSWLSWLWRPLPVAALAMFVVGILGVSIVLRKQNAEFQSVAMVHLPDAGPAQSSAEVVREAPRAEPEPPPRPSSRSAARIATEPLVARRIEEQEEKRANEAVADEPKKREASRDDAVAAEPVRVGEMDKSASAPLAAVPPPPPLPPAPARVAKPASADPLRYWVERRQADGAWTEFGAELSLADQVRLKVIPSQDGYLTMAGNTQAVIAGQTYYLPVETPVQPEVRTLTLALTAAPPPTADATLQRFRQGPGGGRKETAVGAAASEQPAPVAIRRQVQLNFR
ncbi:MAG: hypothetical protein R2729_15275 [Bryobacteraceae bacterium]